jgi:hypothetical protein
MKASELIKKLEAEILLYGDLNIELSITAPDEYLEKCKGQSVILGEPILGCRTISYKHNNPEYQRYIQVYT